MGSIRSGLGSLSSTKWACLPSGSSSTRARSPGRVKGTNSVPFSATPSPPAPSLSMITSRMDRADQEFFVAIFAADWGHHLMRNGPAWRRRNEAPHAGESLAATLGVANDAAFADRLAASLELRLHQRDQPCARSSETK